MSDEQVAKPLLVEKPPRPEVLGGLTIRVVTGCGNMYVQLNWCHGRLFEVFATLGKGGGCAICQSEALTRSVTLGLKCGAPLLEFIRQLRGIRCPGAMQFPREQSVLSCPDAIAKTLERYGTLPVDEVIKVILRSNGMIEAEGMSEDGEAEGAAKAVAELAHVREEQGLRGDI